MTSPPDFIGKFSFHGCDHGFCQQAAALCCHDAKFIEGHACILIGTVRNGADDEERNPVQPAGMGNGSPFHFHTVPFDGFADFLSGFLGSDELVAACHTSGDDTAVQTACFAASCANSTRASSALK